MSEYEKRFYRDWVRPEGLISQEVKIGETDIYISSSEDLSATAPQIIKKYRREIEDYISSHSKFRDNLEPIQEDNLAPPIIKDMIHYSALAGVGPMAGVAGAIAEYAGRELLGHSKEIILENGGDIFLASAQKRTIAIFAGDSPLSNKVSINIKPEDTPIGICTSSGTVGHSLSFGKADSCVIISKSTILADCVATSTANRVKVKDDIRPSLEFAVSIEGIKGAIIILEKEFGILGDIEISGG